jgi:hypothetical protein
MIPKISLAAAFLLLAVPPIACASTRDAINPAPIASNAHESRTGILVAQDAQPAMGTGEGDSATDNDNDNGADDPNASVDDNGNQNGDGGEADQNNAGDDQPVPPTVLNGNDNDSGEVPPLNQLPQSEPMSPQQ